MSTRLFIFCLTLFIFACTQNSTIKHKNENFSENSLPDDFYLVEEIKTSVDSLHGYYKHALWMLSFRDTIGARIYFENAFSIMSNFDEETKTVLMEWSAYDSLIQK